MATYRVYISYEFAALISTFLHQIINRSNNKIRETFVPRDTYSDTKCSRYFAAHANTKHGGTVTNYDDKILVYYVANLQLYGEKDSLMNGYYLHSRTRGFVKYFHR